MTQQQVLEQNLPSTDVLRMYIGRGHSECTQNAQQMKMVQIVSQSLFFVVFRREKGQALSRAMRCSFFKRHDEYTDRINVYTHHERSENKR